MPNNSISAASSRRAYSPSVGTATCVATTEPAGQLTTQKRVAVAPPAMVSVHWKFAGTAVAWEVHDRLIVWAAVVPAVNDRLTAPAPAKLAEPAPETAA